MSSSKCTPASEDNKVESFVFFKDWDLNRREDALRELYNHNIRYIIVSRGFTLLDVHESDEKASEATEFIELAYKKYGIKCVVYSWRGRKPKLFIGEETMKEHAHIAVSALKKLNGVEGLYAIYLDDEPYNTWEFSIDRVRDEYNDLFEKETGHRLPEKGRVKRQWDYETAVTFCKWVGRKYVEYLKTIISEYKKVYPHIKSIVNFHIPSIFPTAENPVDVYGIIETVDIVMHDIYPGWHQYPRALDHIVAFETKFLRCLTDKPLWTILQGHKIMLGYAPTLNQIEQWALDAVECGSDFVGWYACEHDFMIGMWVKLKTEYTRYGSPERWRKMLKASKMIVNMKRKTRTTDIAIFVSYDSLLSYGYLPLMYVFITLYRDAGVEIDFVTEKFVEENPDVLGRYRCIFLGYTPIIRRCLLPILEEYVKKGGLLVACCNDLRFDEKLKSLNEWKEKLFGVIREDVFWKEKLITITERVPELRGVKLKGFWERRAISKREDFTDVLAVWSSGEPAIISRKVGSGRTVYIGTRPYLANCMRSEREWVKLIAWLIITSE